MKIKVKSLNNAMVYIFKNIFIPELVMPIADKWLSMNDE